MTTQLRREGIARSSTTKSVAASLLVAAAMISSCLVPAAGPARAADTFTVDQTIDTPDANVGDGDCDVSLAATGFQCTLRAAIQEANATPEPDLIRFSILDGTPGVETISVGSSGFGPLPAITGPVTIDGYTQQGTSSNTKAVGNDAVLKIKLNGAGAGAGAEGLEITGVSGGSVIKGLVVNGFGGAGIAINGDTSNNRIEGNFIGTNPTGAVDNGNLSDGVAVVNGASQNVVGGTTPAARNVISGNGDSGVFVSNANGNRIEGNYIGTDKSETRKLGNVDSGVKLNNATGNVIGGTTSGAGNLISGNATDLTRGVRIFDGSDNEILGNRIGTTANGNAALGNFVGISMFLTDGNTVGDGSAGGTNTIAFNATDGVAIDGSISTNNSVDRNSIFSNGGLGIDIGGGVENAAGRTANDKGDADGGPNNVQNFPVISSAKTVTGETTIAGKLNSTPNTIFVIQFYANPSGNEGKTFIGREFATTNGLGNASFTFSPVSPVAAGQTVTATATDLAGNTSELSAPR
ncbi:MAG: beta strand repeat-containing protein [Rubrobacter sp.]